MPLHTVRVKYQYEVAFSESLIVAQYVHELSPGPVYIGLCHLAQFVPGKDHVIAVHKKILFRIFFCPGRSVLSRDIFRIAFFFRSIDADPVFRAGKPPLGSAKGTRKDLFQFFFFFRGSKRRAFSPAGSRFCLCFPSVCHAVCQIRQMHMFFYFIPGYDRACAMITEYGVRRIFHICLRIIANTPDHLFRIPAWRVTSGHAGKTPSSFCIGSDFLLIIPHGRHRRGSG